MKFCKVKYLLESVGQQLAQKTFRKPLRTEGIQVWSRSKGQLAAKLEQALIRTWLTQDVAANCQ